MPKATQPGIGTAPHSSRNGKTTRTVMQKRSIDSTQPRTLSRGRESRMRTTNDTSMKTGKRAHSSPTKNSNPQDTLRRGTGRTNGKRSKETDNQEPRTKRTPTAHPWGYRHVSRICGANHRKARRHRSRHRLCRTDTRLHLPAHSTLNCHHPEDPQRHLANTTQADGATTKT